MAQKFRAGKAGQTVVGAQTLKNHEWSVIYKGSDLDTSNFESNGKTQQLTGLVGLDWSLTAHWDAGKNPFDDPPGLYPRDDGAGMELTTNVTDGQNYSMAEFSVSQSQTKCSAAGLVEFDTSGKSQGDFSVPSGSV